MKKSVLLVMVCLLVGLLSTSLFAAGQTEGGKATVLKISTNHPESTPASKGLATFASRVEELTNGSVKAEIFYSSVLGSEREVMEQLKVGAVDMTHVSAGFLSAFVPVVDVFNVPYVFRSSEHYWNVLNGAVGQEIIGDIEDTGYKFLYWEEAGSRSFYNNVRPIYTPEDLKGLKIRVMGSEVMLETMNSLGANPTTTAFAEVYNAMQTGVIDGAENNSISVSSMKHNEVAKYYSLNAHMRIPDLVLMSPASWDKLSDSEKAAFKTAAQEAQDFTIAEWNRQESAAYDIIRETTEINEVPDKTIWVDAVADLHAKLSPKFNGMIEKIKAVK
jgi:tripartite ATP-independent transporter DctP family solute receptor